jgi:ABC-type nitrate/sulfonate/bicarbonate transport system ATPase subunit
LSFAAEHASSIQCQSLSIEYPNGPFAVRDVQLTVPAGEILSLIGPSGCGKTTLLRLMAGLESPTAGTVTLDPPAASQRGGIAFVFQQPTLLPWRTALENVLLPLELIGRGSSSQRRSDAQGMLETVGLSDAMSRFPHQLSGGMKMRVSIARALVTEPSVLLLDEPFAALDDMLRNQLGELLLQLWGERHFTAVMVTHNIAESILLSHRIVVMRDGRLNEPMENPLTGPRNESLRSSVEFGQFYGRVSVALRGVE